MNPRTTGLLALATAILAGFIYFYEIGGESTRQAARDEEKRIYPRLVVDDVDAIELTTDDGVEARFERQAGRWRVVMPISGRADATALDAMVNALANLRREGSVESAGGRDQFGLGEYARTVLFEVAGEPKELRIGRSTPVGGHVYVARFDGRHESARNSAQNDAQSDGIPYVESYRVNAFKRRFDDLRDRRIIGFAVGDVRTLRVAWPAAHDETEVALARDDLGEWQMGAPATGRADQESIRELLSNLSFLRAKGFVDERTDVIDAALAHPAITFYWTAVGDHIERRARIAGDFEEGLLIEGQGGDLYTIDASRMDDFTRTVSHYRFKMLSEFEVARARRVILEFADEGEGPIRVEAGLFETGWSGGEPRIAPDRVSGLVRALSNLRALDIVADEMGPSELASLGLSPPRVTIRIEDRAEADEQTQVLAEVAIGRFDEGRGLFAKRVFGEGEGGPGMVFVLPPSTAGEIPISWAAFLDDFGIRSGDTAEDGEELDPDVLRVDPLEGVEFP